MEIFLFSALVLSVVGHRLSLEENDELQKTCGRTNPVNKSNRIRRSMNTTGASRNEAPFTVMFMFSDHDGGPQERLRTSFPRCSGTIISSRHILTAAACLAEIGIPKCNGDNVEEFVPVFGVENKPLRGCVLKLDYLFITAPTTNCNRAQCDSDFSSVIVKPKRMFVSRAWLNHKCKRPVNGEIRGDVAVVELQEDIIFSDTIQPACINPNVGYNKLLYLYGYGVTEVGEVDTAGVLREHKSWVTTQQRCREYRLPMKKPFLNEEETFHEFPNGTFRIMEDDICTFGPTSKACEGDGGAGMVFREGNQTSVAAVFSFGPKCSRNYTYADGFMDFSVSMAPHADWIWAATGINYIGKDYSEGDIDKFMKDAYTFELSPNFAIEEIDPNGPQPV